jgi:very-short-patch-repair endonuclease
MEVSERRLWQELRSGKLGVPFRRQVVLLNRLIVDF